MSAQEKAVALYTLFYNSYDGKKELEAVKDAIECCNEIEDALEEQGIVTHSIQEYYNEVRFILKNINK